MRFRIAVFAAVLAFVSLAACSPIQPLPPQQVPFTQPKSVFVAGAYCRQVEGDQFMMCRKDDGSPWLRCQIGGRCPEIYSPMIAKQYVWCEFRRDGSLRQAREESTLDSGGSESAPSDPSVCAGIVRDSPQALPHVPAICRQMIGVNSMDCRPQSGGPWELCALWNRCNVQRTHVLEPAVVCVFDAYGDYVRAVKPGADGPQYDVDRNFCDGVTSPPPFARKPSAKFIY